MRREDARIQLSVMGILFNTHHLVYKVIGEASIKNMLCYLPISIVPSCMAAMDSYAAGLAAAATTRISNLLGEGQGHRARDSAATCLVLTLIIDGVFAIGLVSAGPHWARFFTSDTGVVQVSGSTGTTDRVGGGLGQRGRN